MMSKKSKQSSVHRSVRAGVLAALAVLAAPMSSANAEKLELDVAAGEAPDALKEFIRQTGLQLIFDFDSIAAFKTHAVSGQYEAAEALARMLADTGLAFEFVNERTVTVVRKNDSEAPYGKAEARSGVKESRRRAGALRNIRLTQADSIDRTGDEGGVQSAEDARGAAESRTLVRSNSRRLW